MRRLDGPCLFGDDPNEEVMFMNFVENYAHIKEQLAKDPDFKDKAREIVPGKMVVIPKVVKSEPEPNQSLEEELSAMLEQQMGKDLRGSPLLPSILSILQRANTVDLPGNLQHASPGAVTGTSAAAPPLAIRNTSGPDATNPAGPAANPALAIPSTSGPDATNPAVNLAMATPSTSAPDASKSTGPAVNLAMAIPSTSAPDASKSAGPAANLALAIPSTSAPDATKPAGPANLAMGIPSTSVPDATNLAMAIPSTRAPDATSSNPGSRDVNLATENRNPGAASNPAPEPISEVQAVPQNVKHEKEIHDDMEEAQNLKTG